MYESFAYEFDFPIVFTQIKKALVGNAQLIYMAKTLVHSKGFGNSSNHVLPRMPSYIRSPSNIEMDMLGSVRKSSVNRKDSN